MKSFKNTLNKRRHPRRLDEDGRISNMAVHSKEQGRLIRGKRFGKKWYPYTKAE
jgi:hypothetical protein